MLTFLPTMAGGISSSLLPLTGDSQALTPGVPGIPLVPGLPGFPRGPVIPGKYKLQ